jgi:hypothetical protein
MQLSEGLVPGLLVLSMPTALSAALFVRLRKLRRAASWPVVTGRITKSDIESETLRDGSVRNRPAVSFEFEVGGKRYQGSRVHVVDGAGNAGKPDETLVLYPVGASVPICYNPADPTEAALERNPPLRLWAMYAVVGAIFLAGVGAALAVVNLEAVMARLEAVFPPNAAPQAVLFFAAAGLVTLWVTLGNARDGRRARSWPTVEGAVVASHVESYLARTGDPTRGARTRLYRPRIEYAYVVGRQEYHSTRVRYGGEVSSASEEWAKAQVAVYPKDAKVVVHYDPKAASRAVLETGLGFPVLSWAIVAAFFAAAVWFSGVGR